jgi:hypothetical protein
MSGTYPGRLIRLGEADRAVVAAVQSRLRILGFAPLDASGTFGPRTKASVMLFQTRNVDVAGRPLKQDGVVGSLTWASLFGAGSVPQSEVPASPLLAAFLERAAAEVGVREQPKDSNSGPEVDGYLRRVGVPLSLPVAKKPWCCAFVYACFDDAAQRLGRANPMVRTAGCLDHWNRAEANGARRIKAGKAVQNPALVSAGMVFIIDHGSGRGHTGVIERVVGGAIDTIEGNTNASKTREGGGVYRLSRKMVEINTGYIDYGAV